MSIPKWGFKELIDTELFILKPRRLLMGGVAEFLKTAALSQAHCLELAPHGDHRPSIVSLSKQWAMCL